MPKVKFKRDGRFADPQPMNGQIEAAKDQELEVNVGMADFLVKEGIAEYVKEPSKAPANKAQPKKEGNPAQEDKKKAEG